MDDMNIQDIDVKEETQKAEEARFESKEKETVKEVHEVKKSDSDTGVSVFILGLLSILLAVLGNTVLPLIGVILGLIAVIKGSKLRKKEDRPGIITAGWIMGIVGMVLSAVVLIFSIIEIASVVSVMVPHRYYFRYLYF